MRSLLVAAVVAAAAASPGSLGPAQPAQPAPPRAAPTLMSASPAILAFGGPAALAQQQFTAQQLTVWRGGPLRPVAPGPPRPATPQGQDARYGLDNPAWALVLMTMIMAYEEYGWF